MTARTLILTAAGLAALSLAACNRPGDEAETAATDASAMQTQSTEAEMTAGSTSGSTTSGASAGTSATGGSGSGAAASTTTGAGATTTTGGTVAVTGQVNSSIPADAPSRNTRETAAAPGAANRGEVMPYAYSPTNPALDKDR